MTEAGRTADRPFRLFWAGQTVSVLGDGVATLAIPLLVLERTDSPVAAALSATPRTVGYLLAGVVAGVVVDRAPVKAVAIACDVVRAALFGLLFVLTALDVVAMWHILAIAFLAAAAGVFFETAAAVGVQDLLRADQLVRGNSRLEVSNQLGLLVGPALAGVLADRGGLDLCLAVNGATFVVSIATLLPIHLPAGDRAPSGVGEGLRSFGADIAEGLRYIRGERRILSVVTLQALVNFLFAAETLLIFFAREVLGASSAGISAVVICGAAGGIAGGLLAARLPPWPPSAVIGGAVVVLGLAICGFAAAGGIVVLAAFNTVAGAAVIVASVNIRALRQRVAPRELLGRVTSTARTVAFVAHPAGAVLAGVVTSAAGGDPRPAFLAAGVLGTAAAAVGYAIGLRPAERAAAAAAAQAPVRHPT